MSNGKSEAAPEPGQNGGQERPRFRRWYLVAELIALIVFVGTVVWLFVNYQPSTPMGRVLINYRIWILVAVVSIWGTSGGLIPYYVGRRGTRTVFNSYPQLEGRRWERLVAVFERWGALSLVLSGIPVLGAAFLVAAGAVGIGRRDFLFWTFVGKLLRNWVLAFVVLSSLQLVG